MMKDTEIYGPSKIFTPAEQRLTVSGLRYSRKIPNELLVKVVKYLIQDGSMTDIVSSNADSLTYYRVKMSKQ